LKELVTANKFALFVVLSVIFNIAILSNLLQSDYFGDDLYNFQVPGTVPLIFPSVFDLTKHYFMEWINVNGRFFPVAWYVYYVFYIFDTLFAYKLFLLGITLAGIGAFSYLLYLLSKDKYMSLLFLFLTPVFFQYRFYHDPMLSFHGLMQILFLYITLSFIFLSKYLQGSSRHSYYVSLFFFTLALLTYEISYLFIFLFIPVVLSHMELKNNLRKIFYLSIPYVLILCFLALFTLFLRSSAAANGGAYVPNWDLLAIFKTYFNQTISVIPTSYSVATGNISAFYHFITFRDTAIALFFILLYIYSISFKKQNVLNKNLLLLGVLIIVLPGLLISLSPKYQQEISFGVAYLPIYIQSFGASLLLALLIRKISSIKSHLIIAFLLCTVLLIHLTTNSKVIDLVNQSFKPQREILTLFFSDSFGKELPNHSTIQFPSESPLHRKEFLNMLTGKDINVVIAPNDAYDYKLEYTITQDRAKVSITKRTTKAQYTTLYFKDDIWRKTR
jgi:hypothetical protein